MKMNGQSGQNAQTQPGGGDDLAELERTRQAYKAARKRLGMSYAPRVAAAVVAGLLLFGGGAGGMYLLLNDGGASAKESAEKMSALQDELDKTKEELEDAKAELAEVKEDTSSETNDNSKKGDDGDSSASYDPTSLVGTWTGKFKETQSHMGENCLFGRNNPAKLVVKNWDPDTKIFDANLTVAYHGHDTSDIGAQVQTVPGDEVKEYKNISGTIEFNGMATWNFKINDEDEQQTVDITLEVEGLDDGNISAEMIVRSYFNALVPQVTDTYELTRS